MKPTRKNPLLAAFITLALSAQSAFAVAHYWDNNTGTTGFGSAGGTWGTSVFWNTASSGLGIPAVTLITTNDQANFGTDSVALGGGTITVSGTVNAASLRFGSQTSSAVTLSGGIINLAATTSIHVGSGTPTHIITSQITGAATSLTKTGNTLRLDANNSYTGSTIISSGTLILNNSTVLGGNVPGTNGTSSISMAANSTLQSNYAPADAGVSDSYVYAPITLTAAGTNNFLIGNGNSTSPAESVRFNLNGAIGGTAGANVVFGNTAATRNNADSMIVLGAASTYNGTTTIQAGHAQNRINVIAGVENALPTTTVLGFDALAGSGSGRTTQFDLNGNNQTLAGLSNGGVVGADRNLRVNSATAATLTINNTSNFTFGGATRDDSTGTGQDGTITSAQIIGAISLVKSGTGTFTLGGTLGGTVNGAATAQGNSFTGNTKILGGILVLGESTSIRNSAFDTTSIIGGASDGLRVGIGGTGVTTLTIGGLIGGNNFSTRFTSTTGGYNNLTTLTLNPGTDVTYTYSGDVGNGGGSMILTKATSGTQVFTAAQTFTGNTNVNGGTLQLSTSGQLGSGSYNANISIANTALLRYSSTVDQTLGGTVSGLGAITKDTGTASTLTLSGNNSYDGTTTVSAGTLLINGNSSTANGAVNVTGGTLGGTGTTGGAITVSGGATLSPGASIESLIAPSLSMASTSVFAYEVADNSSTGADALALSGAISLNNVTLSLDVFTQAALAGSWTLGNKLTLISYFDAGAGITSGFTGYSDNTSYFFGANEWLFDYNDTVAGGNYVDDVTNAGSNRFVTMTVVPEPSAALLGGLGLLMLVRRRR
jgi:autotransporter-associated beta strand protein